ncbi:MAG: GlsB/YeaQ/YmgE family stress response membrane protein [Candidatus Binatia bacterium]|jgi:uncharacterized membrane protein YeaQ/YmgE (transglycosylase-associated protein family)
MGIISWIVFGLIAGVFAKMLMPSDDPEWIITTIVIGIVGAVVSGFLAVLLGFGDISGFDFRSFVIAMVGGLLLLGGYRLLKRT